MVQFRSLCFFFPKCDCMSDFFPPVTPSMDVPNATFDADAKQLFLIDGSGYIFRAYHALPPLTAPDKTPVGAVYGFCNMLKSLIAAHKKHHFLVVFDAGRQTFRQDIYADYKAHRPPAPDDLVPQFALIHEACRAFGVPCIDMEGYEADDLIASYARAAAKQGFSVTIVSADKDLMQLVDDQIYLYDPMKKKAIKQQEVIDKFGVPPRQVIDVQALAGDSSDNVPGVPGIGIKTAADLISTYMSLELLLASAHTIKQPKRRQSLIEHAGNARISKKLVTLVDDLPLPLPIDSLFVKDITSETVHFLDRMGFKTLSGRAQAELNGLASKKGDQQTEMPAVFPLPSVAPLTILSHESYQMLTHLEGIQDFLQKAMQSGVVAFDVETTSLKIHDAVLVGCSLAYRDDTHQINAVYIPFCHRNEDGSIAEGQADFDAVKPLLKAFLNEKGVLKVGHNLKYDMAILKGVGLALQSYDDTMLMSYCLHGGLHGHSMEVLAKEYFNLNVLSYESVCGSGKNQKTFDQVPLDQATLYSAEDAEITLMLHDYLKPKLIDYKVLKLYQEIERPLLPSVVQMEWEGITIDKDALSAFGLELNRRLKDLQDDVYKIAGHEFNIGSPKQLGVVLFEEQGMPAPKMTKTGSYMTDADVLEALVQRGYDLPKKILEWRSLSKLLSTYVEALPQEISLKTGRVHTSYALSGTATGRFSSSDPNLQNIPIRSEDGRRIRQAFIAKPGYCLMAFDYSQIELRLLAHFADVPTLRDAFLNNIDSHTMTASQLFGVPYDAVTSDQRRQAKTVNFGIIYGISPFGLATQLMISKEDAALLIKTYLDQYPGVELFMSEKKKEAMENGYVTTLFGRRCYTPGIHDRNPALRHFAERQAINAPLQGSNADIIKKAMAAIHQWIDQQQVDARMLLQVHDELVFEVKDDPAVIDAVKTSVQHIMESIVTLKLPLKVDVGVGKNWDEAHMS